VTGLTVAAALSYGELAGMMPKAGGQFVYIQRAYGRLVSFFIWTVLPLFRLELLLQLQLRLQTILRYSSGIRYYTFLDWAIVLFFLLVNCWLSQVLLYSRSSILKGLKGKLIQLILTSAKLIALLH
jgi:APA family basic amino acid/polyamine antiporter